MSWARLDDRWDIGTKMTRAFARVGDAGLCVWVRAVTHCNREETNGIVHADVLKTFTKHRKPVEVVAALIEVRALHDEAGRLACEKCAAKYPKPLADGDLIVHDFLDWNDSKETIAAKREAKQKAGKKGGFASGETRKANQNGSNDEAEPKQVLRESLPAGSVPANQNEPLSTPIRSDPDLISENSEKLSPPARPNGPHLPQGQNKSAQAPGLGQQVLAELRLHPSLESIAQREFGIAVGAHLMTAGKAMPWVLQAIRDVAVVVAGSGMTDEAKRAKVFSFIKNARPPRETDAPANDSRAIAASPGAPPTALPQAKWAEGLTEPKRREATPEELREAAIVAHRSGFVPPPLEPYLPAELREVAS